MHRNCTEFTSTTCVPCLPLTFTDKPNGLMSCRLCLGCEAGENISVDEATVIKPYNLFIYQGTLINVLISRNFANTLSPLKQRSLNTERSAFTLTDLSA